ncbi:hypothetical protein AB0L82_13380 [Nocardia sp. NPDC052001]|uniref:hypothetical protein n=1 Tax=Nocardia sp. NPDC052001 TaxID=3154853 RepID=UPI00342F4028
MDNSLWDGVVCDSTDGALRVEAVRALRILRERGVMHAVASRGELSWTVAQLRKHGLHDRFAAVEVGWGKKSAAITRIAQTLGVNLDQVGYIDAEPLERTEVGYALPQVRCYAARHIDVLPALQEFRAPAGDVPPPTSPMGIAHIHAR